MKTATQLLNIYMRSGGTKASYEDVQKACQREKWEAKKADLKKTPLLWIITIPVTYAYQKFDKFLDDAV